MNGFTKWLEVFNSLPENTEKTIWTNENNEELSGPICNDHLTAQITIGKDEYKINFESIDDNVVEINFMTKRKGVFSTYENIPFFVLNKIMAVIGQYLNICKNMSFVFNPNSFGRLRVFDKIISRMLPEFSQQENGIYKRST